MDEIGLKLIEGTGVKLIPQKTFFTEKEWQPLLAKLLTQKRQILK